MQGVEEVSKEAGEELSPKQPLTRVRTRSRQRSVGVQHLINFEDPESCGCEPGQCRRARQEGLTVRGGGEAGPWSTRGHAKERVTDLLAGKITPLSTVSYTHLTLPTICSV